MDGTVERCECEFEGAQPSSPLSCNSHGGGGAKMCNVKNGHISLQNVIMGNSFSLF